MKSLKNTHLLYIRIFSTSVHCNVPHIKRLIHLATQPATHLAVQPAAHAAAYLAVLLATRPASHHAVNVQTTEASSSRHREKLNLLTAAPHRLASSTTVSPRVNRCQL